MLFARWFLNGFTPQARGALVAAFVTLIMASCICQDPNGFMNRYEALSLLGSDCSCNGSTLTCTQGGQSASTPNAYTCNPENLNRDGMCACSGSTLVCSFYVCKWDSFTMSAGEDTLYAPCTAGGDNKTVGARGEIWSAGSTTLSFAHAAQCPASVDTDTPSATSTATPQGPADTPTATVTVTATETASPTPTDTPTNTAVAATKRPTATNTAIPSQCGPGWLPNSGCDCCGSTLVCSDGTTAAFNPQCTGGKPGPVGTP